MAKTLEQLEADLQEAQRYLNTELTHGSRGFPEPTDQEVKEYLDANPMSADKIHELVIAHARQALFGKNYDAYLESLRDKVRVAENALEAARWNSEQRPEDVFPQQDDVTWRMHQEEANKEGR